MIQSFGDKDTAALWDQQRVAKLQQVKKVAYRKLTYLHSATSLIDLRSPPGNRLEPLVGDRKGQHSIRINDQYRICFRWTANGAQDVEISKHYE